MDRIDFRSDTVTWPTPSMRQAMAEASVGDDVYGEDPTVNELESLAASRVGMEAGLFVASGTMGNITAILSHTNRGDEAILGSDAHVMHYEGGGISRLAGVMPKPLPTDNFGRMSSEQIVESISPDDPHYPRTALILLENSYAARNGYPLSTEYFAEIHQIARDNGLAIHMDGARLFNAAIALHVEVSEITRYVDSLSFCFSKGLCAPVGSVLCGSEPFIKRARRERKVLGGGMRQAGILAAAGIVALNEMVDRLADDHANAKYLSRELADIPGILIDPTLIRTNIVFFELDQQCGMKAGELAQEVKERSDIWLDVVSDVQLRAVTHYWVGETEIDLLIRELRLLLARGVSS